MRFNPAHPAPCLYLKHGAYWLVKRNKWERLGGENDLERVMAEYARRMQAPKAGKLPALIDDTLARHFRATELSDATKAQYRIAANVLKRKFANFDSPSQIVGRHIAKIKADGHEHRNMTNRVVSLMRTLCAYWVEDQSCDSNPCIGVKRYSEPKRTRLITAQEWSAIYEHAGPRLQVIMRVALCTGQRIGDVLKIHRRQITEEGIDFKQQKTKKLLTVRWSPDLVSAVADAKALHGVPALWLFVGRRGKHADYRTVHLQWAKACEAAGVTDARPNDQRAQSLTAANRQGKSATKLAGHATEQMTERYIRERVGDLVDGPDLRQALDVRQGSPR